MEEYCGKRSGQIPAFGNWDYTNDLPITQYFECARQAGLIRYSSSSGECDLYVADADPYAVDSKKHPLRPSVVPPRKNKEEQMRRKVIKVCDVTKVPRKQAFLSQKQQLKQQQQLPKHHHNAIHHRKYISGQQQQPNPTKPVDEDLYKIPPELLRTSNRKKMLGFFSRCLVPGCVA
ncbi:uncharacterized protein LOC132271273 isoform X2 [Cornus florida]|uniref:uncharacterized protein LOC132271273 isoform X2 n=1 Tax=Cornus florida TaxID=4283 RepID=UPI00289A4B25|nr:uncharacterized protein LOC132271273 isoform X2 [Cornus florida]